MIVKKRMPAAYKPMGIHIDNTGCIVVNVLYSTKPPCKIR